MLAVSHSRLTRRLALSVVIVLIPTILGCCTPDEPPEHLGEKTPSDGSEVILEDEGKIFIQHGSSCGESNQPEEQNEIEITDSIIIPGYADKATVFLNGWFAAYLEEEHHVRMLSAEITDIQIGENRLKWRAAGYLRDENFDDPYKWCYFYTALAWNGSLIDATVDHRDSNLSFISYSEKEFPNEETALVTLKPFIQNPAFLSKQTGTVIPRGFSFNWANEAGLGKFDAPVDHHLLQIAYNLDHTELFIEKGEASMPTASYDQGFISWVTHGIFKDDDDKRNYGFTELVSAFGGNDVEVVHPPFAIRPYAGSGTGSWQPGGVHTEEYVVSNVPFEYAVPVLTGWDMRYPYQGDHEVLQIGIWLH